MTNSQSASERQVKLLLALDEARDTVTEDPQVMFTKVVRAVRDNLAVAAAAIYILEETAENGELLAVDGWSAIEARRLCRTAFTYTTPQTITDTTFAHTLGVRIHLEQEDQVSGGLVVGRAHPFDADDLALLVLAESQIDSAVTQARSTWRLAERNRELEAIFQIDRLRDHAKDEDSLLSSFTGLLVDHFNAELCIGQTQSGR
jgi:GAF domain-containing protein